MRPATAVCDSRRREEIIQGEFTRGNAHTKYAAARAAVAAAAATPAAAAATIAAVAVVACGQLSLALLIIIRDVVTSK